LPHIEHFLSKARQRQLHVGVGENRNIISSVDHTDRFGREAVQTVGIDVQSRLANGSSQVVGHGGPHQRSNA
jgi:hypothetical protein